MPEGTNKQMEVDPKDVQRIDRDVGLLSETVAKLSNSQASMMTAIEGLATSMHDMRGEFRSFSKEHAPKPTSALNLAMGLFGLFGILLTVTAMGMQYVGLTIEPEREKIAVLQAENDAAHVRALGYARERGRNEAILQGFDRRLAEVEDLIPAVSAIENQVESNRLDLETIDMHGSRKWVGREDG